MARKVTELDTIYLQRIKELDQKLYSLATLSSTYQNKIIEDVNTYLKYESDLVLKEMPVDEINRDKLGIRVGLLKNNGLTTISSVLNVSVMALNRINGIGEDSARTIKNAAISIQKETIKNCKFKIEMNPRNTYQSEVLKDIQQLFQFKEIQNKAKLLYNNTHSKINELLNTIEFTKNWFGQYKVATGKNPEVVMNNMDLIIQLVKGDYGKQVAGLLDEYNINNSNVKYDEHFYFMNHEAVHKILVELIPNKLDPAFKRKITNTVVMPDFSDALIVLNQYKELLVFIQKVKKESMTYHNLYQQYLETKKIDQKQLFHYLTFKDFYDRCNQMKIDDHLLEDLKIIQSKNEYLNSSENKQKLVLKRVEELKQKTLELNTLKNEYDHLMEIPFDENTCKEHTKATFKEDTSIYKMIYDSISLELKIQVLANCKVKPYNEYANGYLKGKTTVIKKENTKLLLEANLIHEVEYNSMIQQIEKQEAINESFNYTTIELMDDKKVIVNNFKYLTFQQVDDLSEDKKANKMECYFIEGNEVITNKVVIDVNQKAGHIYREKFDFISKAYDAKKPYYLVLNDYKGREIKRYQYKIDLAFSNDFDF